MIILSITEHLEKIPYLLSLFFPVALFFLAGLAIACWIWYKDARRLQSALAEHDRLTGKLSSGFQKENDLVSRFSGLFGKQQEHWENEVSEREERLVDLEEDYSGLKSEFDNDKGEADQLRSKLGNFDSTLSEKDQELERLKSQLSDLEKGSADKEDEIGKLRRKVSGFEESANGQEEELSQLKADLAKSTTAMGLLQTQSDGGKDESAELKAQVADLKAQLAKQKEEANAQNQAPKTHTNGGDASSLLGDFDNEDVKFDEKLGVLYKSKPERVDDLKKIKGVADVLEGKLHDFGVYRYKQVALWDKENIDEFSERLSFPDRIERDQWIAQALDYHRDEYKERLAPRYTVYHDVPAPKPAEVSEPSSSAASFEGEPVEVDPKLGVLFTTRPTKVDDLKRISGVAGVLEGKLHEIGLYRFQQIALWTDEQAAAFSDKLAFPGRVERDEWVKQAAAFHAEEYGES